MHAHEPSDFFGNLKSTHTSPHTHAPHHGANSLNTSAQTPPIPPKPRLDLHIRIAKWFIPVAIAIILTQIIGVFFWYGYKEKEETKVILNDALAKLQIVEQNGYNVKGFYSQLNEYDERLRTFPEGFMPFTVSNIKTQVVNIDTKVTSQYSAILENEKSALFKKINEFGQYIFRTNQFDYANKKEVTAYYEELNTKIQSSAVSMQQLSTYTQEVGKKEELMREGLKPILKQEFEELQKDYSVAVNYNYPSRVEIETFIEQYAALPETKQRTITEIITELEKITKYRETISTEVEMEKKKIVFANISNLTQEVDSLLAFFSQRSGYLNEMAQLNQYKNIVTQYTEENFKSYTSGALQQKAEKELYPLVVQPRKVKLEVEERERQELSARQRQMALESGIPVPPISAPKLVYINVGKQRLYAYENGVSIFEQPIPITTGKAGYDTVKGRFAIYLKATNFRMRSPFPNEWYDNYVDYWMPFFEGYGLHDASWRSVYGTMDYPALGSHGCVNIPYVYVQQLFAWAEVGTPVIVE